jgi:hypothetical protein
MSGKHVISAKKQSIFSLSMDFLFLFIIAFSFSVFSITTMAQEEEPTQDDKDLEKSEMQHKIDATYSQDTLLEQAGSHLGKGAEGIAKVMEKLFSDLGRPNGYIVGSEASGAFFAGLKTGNGQLFHKIEGQQKVHWIGPSIGIEAGGNLSKVFILVYNLYDTEDLFKRYPALEGNAYFIGGVSVSYHQKGDVILAPIKLGVGMRLGGNVNYVKFTKKKTYNPF